MVVGPIDQGELSSMTRPGDTITYAIPKEANASRFLLIVVNNSSVIVNDSATVLYALKGRSGASPRNCSCRVRPYSTLTLENYIGPLAVAWGPDVDHGGEVGEEPQDRGPGQESGQKRPCCRARPGVRNGA